MFAITSYVVKDLRDRAATLNIAGRSAMGKADLYAAITEALDTAHGIALEIDSERRTTAITPDVIDEGYSTLPGTVTYLLKTDRRFPRKLKKRLRKSGVLA